MVSSGEAGGGEPIAQKILKKFSNLSVLVA